MARPGRLLGPSLERFLICRSAHVFDILTIDHIANRVLPKANQQIETYPTQISRHKTEALVNNLDPDTSPETSCFLRGREGSVRSAVRLPSGQPANH